jgi:hypothetical protein
LGAEPQRLLPHGITRGAQQCVKDGELFDNAAQGVPWAEQIVSAYQPVPVSVRWSSRLTVCAPVRCPNRALVNGSIAGAGRTGMAGVAGRRGAVMRAATSITVPPASRISSRRAATEGVKGLRPLRIFDR